MQHVVMERDGLYVAPVAAEEAEYLRDGIIPTLRPMSDEEYMTGPAVIWATGLRWSHVLFGDDVYWITEYSPGAIVVRFSPDGQMARAGLRSPSPGFGTRMTDRDRELFNPAQRGCQHRLVMEGLRDCDNEELFQPADDQTTRRFRAAVAHGGELGHIMEARYSDSIESWADQCKANLKEWMGEGVRILRNGKSW